MEDRTKLAAAAAGGYLAGRAKKGRAAFRLVMWLSGDQSGPRALNAARTGAIGLYQSEQAQLIAKQVSGPLAEAIQKAAVAAVMARVQGLSDNLASRTLALEQTGVKELTDASKDVTGAAAAPTKKAGKSLKDRLRPWGSSEQDSESQDTESEDEQSPEEMGQDEPDDGQDQDQEPGQDDEDQEPEQDQEEESDDGPDPQEEPEEGEEESVDDEPGSEPDTGQAPEAELSEAPARQARKTSKKSAPAKKAASDG